MAGSTSGVPRDGGNNEISHVRNTPGAGIGQGATPKGDGPWERCGGVKPPL